ncbi:C factor cell-cell signaling protein [Vibrio ichthyoenteri ATCC 700023]|uniref:C factor cell-cell signaling protein n=1 Tax=Vibrio ichthyoenteri ATCC 700023 TaxID=870968 RepID=F9S6Q9_9VIBR|nr:SDR family oxidoreductase [Vibrio ichthyoenteri]EGU32609.1 C factor cell-cell signaling protein [Vibrio ichthyoenteri ATCC 700023]
MEILIVGGNGGIGFAMVRELLTRYQGALVHATYRHVQPKYQHDRLQWHQLDVTEEAQIAALSAQFTQLDWLVNCVGMLHTPTKGPEKNLASVNSDFFLQTISVNTLPTLLLAKYFSPRLKPSLAPKLATISARVGSIEDNRLGGWYSYRASKAALNMLLKTIAIEWQRTMIHGAVLSLHPGTTDTPLSAPFQANVPQGKLFKSQRVACDLIGLIEAVTPQQSGAFWAYNGEVIPW